MPVMICGYEGYEGDPESGTLKDSKFILIVAMDGERFCGGCKRRYGTPEWTPILGKAVDMELLKQVLKLFLR